MKKALIPILIFLGVATWGLWPESQPAVGGKTPTPEEVVSFVRTFQADYLAQNGKYFQVPRTLGVPPSTATKGNFLKTLDDQDFNLAHYITFTDTLPFSIQIDTCDNGTKGYTLTLSRTTATGEVEDMVDSVGSCAMSAHVWQKRMVTATST